MYVCIYVKWHKNFSNKHSKSLMVFSLNNVGRKLALAGLRPHSHAGTRYVEAYAHICMEITPTHALTQVRLVAATSFVFRMPLQPAAKEADRCKL